MTSVRILACSDNGSLFVIESSHVYPNHYIYGTFIIAFPTMQSYPIDRALLLSDWLPHCAGWHWNDLYSSSVEVSTELIYG